MGWRPGAGAVWSTGGLETPTSSKYMAMEVEASVDGNGVWIKSLSAYVGMYAHVSAASKATGATEPGSFIYTHGTPTSVLRLMRDEALFADGFGIPQSFVLPDSKLFLPPGYFLTLQCYYATSVAILTATGEEV